MTARREHEQRCIPLSQRDEGHQRYIDSLQELIVQCDDSLNIAYTSPRPDSPLPDLFVEEPEPEPVRVPISEPCVKTRAVRESACARIPKDLLIGLKFPSNQSDTGLFEEELMPRVRAVDSCLAAADAEVKACGQTEIDTNEMSDRARVAVKRLHEHVNALPRQSELLMTDYQQWIRTKAAREFLRDELRELARERKALIDLFKMQLDLGKNIPIATNRQQALAIKARARASNISVEAIRRLITKRYRDLEPLLRKVETAPDTLTFTDFGLLAAIDALSLPPESTKYLQDSVTLTVDRLEKANQWLLSLVPPYYDVGYGSALISQTVDSTDDKPAVHLLRLGVLDQFLRDQYKVSLQAQS